jgi:hypothetical protein
MEVDDGAAPASSKAPKKRNNNDKTKAKRKIKPRNQVAFPKSRGKGALKPFSDSRIRKSRKA